MRGAGSRTLLVRARTASRLSSRLNLQCHSAAGELRPCLKPWELLLLGGLGRHPRCEDIAAGQCGAKQTTHCWPRIRTSCPISGVPAASEVPDWSMAAAVMNSPSSPKRYRQIALRVDTGCHPAWTGSVACW